MYDIWGDGKSTALPSADVAISVTLKHSETEWNITRILLLHSLINSNFNWELFIPADIKAKPYLFKGDWMGTSSYKALVDWKK